MSMNDMAKRGAMLTVLLAIVGLLGLVFFQNLPEIRREINILNM